jgi:pimeloyl-ACP methyl ester carboxylesterase
VPDEYVDYGAETARMEGAAYPLDDFLGGRLFTDAVADTFTHLSQPLLIIHGSVQDRRMESYSELPDLVNRPNTTVVSLPTGALPHWERPGVVMERMNEFYADVDRIVAQEV